MKYLRPVRLIMSRILQGSEHALTIEDLDTTYRPKQTIYEIRHRFKVSPALRPESKWCSCGLASVGGAVFVDKETKIIEIRSTRVR